MRLGQNTYCLVRAGATHYRGVLSYALAGRLLTVTLTPDAADVLELPEVVEMKLGGDGAVVLAARLPALLT